MPTTVMTVSALMGGSRFDQMDAVRLSGSRRGLDPAAGCGLLPARPEPVVVSDGQLRHLLSVVAHIDELLVAATAAQHLVFRRCAGNARLGDAVTGRQVDVVHGHGWCSSRLRTPVGVPLGDDGMAVAVMTLCRCEPGLRRPGTNMFSSFRSGIPERHRENRVEDSKSRRFHVR
jgi:hypothetical protein